MSDEKTPLALRIATNPLLIGYLQALGANPLRTKMYTSGVLSALSEVLAGKFAGVPTAAPSASEKRATEKPGQAAVNHPVLFAKALLRNIGINERALKMFVYGFLISAPLGHVMTGALQRAFAGRTTAKDKILQIITSNLTVSVVGNLVYITSMAYINGARSPDRILAAVKATFPFLMKVTWVTSPILIAVAQNYLPPEVWEPFFTFARFILGTYFNTVAKKKQMALARREAAKGKGPKSVEGDRDLQKGAAEGK